MKYILDDYKIVEKTAASKARRDIENILENVNTIYFAYSNNKVIDLLITIFNIIKTKVVLKCEDMLIIQWPLGLRLSLKKGKFIRYLSGRKIALIHDINSLRYNPLDKEKINNEIGVLNTFDAIIAHNSYMKKWLLENGIKKPVYELELFDYLSDVKANKRVWQSKDKYQVSIAGNLAIEKSGYIYKLVNSRKYELLVYGVNFRENSKITYKGNFNSEELPNIIEGDFGLVWDGTSLECCEGNTGNYLRYNNPHKLSLYVCAAMPVIVWSEAAVAKFVKENNIGFCVNCLQEIDEVLSHMTKDEYETYCENVWRLSKRVRKGYYTKKVLREINF